MTENIPALLRSKVAKILDDRLPSEALDYKGLDGLTTEIVAALESLSAPPATDDEREAMIRALSAHVLVWHKPSLSAACRDPECGMPVMNLHDVMALPDAQARHQVDILAAGFRRPSPLTREALKRLLEVGDHDWSIDYPDDPYGARADAILSAFSLPEPAEVEWEYALMQGDRVDEVFDSMDDLADYYGIRFHEGEYPVRRVKAGPWVPVKGAEQ